MGAATGIAGSHRPEAEGVFLCSDEDEAGYFVAMNNTGGPVDVWTVARVSEDQLVRSGTGYSYLPRRIPAEDLTLVAEAVVDETWRSSSVSTEPTAAYQSNLTITLDDGRVLRDSEAHEFVRQLSQTSDAGDEPIT